MKPRPLPRRRAFRHGTRGTGFSLIEVMIAIFVVGVGLLGFAMLQTKVLRYSQSANFRTQATSLAYDLFDQMRANRGLLGQYEKIDLASLDGKEGAVTGQDCAHDTGRWVNPTANIKRWQCQVRAALGPGATASVRNNASSGRWTVTIRWAETGQQDGDDSTQVQVVSTL